MGADDATTRLGTSLRLAVGFLALIAFVLGIVGFASLPLETPQTESDVVYYTLQLYVLAAEPFAMPLPTISLWLEIARFLAPATTALALVLTARTVISSTYYAVRTRRLTGHTVVCGSGPAAFVIARGVGAEGRACVVVDGGDRRTAPSRLDAPPDAHGTVVRVAGDARESDVLAAAGVGRAYEVVIVTGDGARNADIAVSVRAAIERRDDPPRCFVEAAAPELAAALAAHEINARSRVHVEFFDPAHHAARRLLDTHLRPIPEDHHVLVAGAGVLRDALLVELELRSRRVGTEIDVRAVPLSEMDSMEADDQMAVAVLCDDDDVRCVRAGLRLVRRLARMPVDVVVSTSESTALGAVITGDELAAGAGSRARLRLFNAAEHIYDLRALRSGVFEDIARAAHEDYVRRAREHGNASADVAVGWEHLPREYQDANIDQALAVGQKLREIGCAVVPADDLPRPDGPTFAFEGNELENLAQMEHRRWCAERRRNGWATGPRDDAAKTHPDLAAWDELAEASKEKDRDAVRDLPRQLSLVGLRIIRAAPTER